MAKIVLVSRCAWTLYNFRQGQIRALTERGDEVIGAGAGGDGYEAKISSLGIPFVSLPVNKRTTNPFADVKLLWTLVRWYRRERPEIVHHFTIKPVIYGSLAARFAGVPRVVNTVTGLGYAFSEGSASWLRRLVEWQYRVALKKTHHVFFQNPDDRALFVERGLVSEAKTSLLPGSGVDTHRFTPQEPSAEKTGPVCFLMMARLLREKGVYEFADAARRVKAQFPQTRFLLAGGRDERNPGVVPQEDLALWTREKVLEWVGEVADVREVLTQADVVVLPSYYREGTPRSLLEAAAMGKPLITTDNVGCREAVEDEVNGLLVPPRDSHALADAMIRLLGDAAARQRMGLAGRERVVREFDEAIVLNRVVEVYNKEMS